MMPDSRIPVRIASIADAGATDALLVEGALPRTTLPCASFGLVQRGHVPACTCCAPRSSAAMALAALFTGRALARFEFFTGVVAVVTTKAGEAAVMAALQDDPVASARFRLV